MARIALGGSFRTIRSYGMADVGSYLRSLREAKQQAEDTYWDAALSSGEEKPEDVLAYWQGQRDRFPVGSIEYKTYQAKLKRINETIDTSKVNALIAEKKYDDAIDYYERNIITKYEKDSPAWSDAFVRLQQLKDARTANEISLEEAKLRAKWSVGGLSGKNLVSYYADLLKFMDEKGYQDREEYFKVIEGQNEAVAQAQEQEKAKETAQFNKRMNELIGEIGGPITSKDWVNIYNKLAGEFPQGSEAYAKALEGLTKAQEQFKGDREAEQKNAAKVIMNTVLQKYSEGGITDREYASALQEMLTMLPQGSEEANEVARQLGNLQETLAGQGAAEAKQQQVSQLLQEITQYEAQAEQLQAKYAAGLIPGMEYDEARKQFLERVAPLYESLGQYTNDRGVYEKMAEYGQELNTLPEKMQQRQMGTLVDRVIVDEQGNRKIKSIDLRSIDPATIGNILDVITDKGVEQFVFNPNTKAWTDSQGNVFAKIATTKEARDNFALPAGLKPAEIAKRIDALDEAMSSGQQVDFKSILNPAQPSEQPNSFSFGNALKNIGGTIAGVARTPYETVYGGSPSTFKLPEINISQAISDFKLPSVQSVVQPVSNWFTSNVWDPGAGTGKVESTVKNIGSTIASTAKNLWEGFKSKTSKWSPFW